jgi:hypothetical protein
MAGVAIVSICVMVVVVVSRRNECARRADGGAGSCPSSCYRGSRFRSVHDSEVYLYA